jgi:4-hydroxy-tetrahydrodipicolinate synthase
VADRQTPGKHYQGAIVPIVTPLTAQGELDEVALRRIIDFLAAGGVQGIFALGTTGEGPSVPRDIRPRLVRLAVDYAGGRLQVYAGIASTVLEESADAAKEYIRHGVTAVVAPLPGYYLLTADEQFRYFATLLERIHGPLLLYDIPAAVHNAIDPGVIEHLRVFPNVVGIKDSSGDRERLAGLLSSYSDDPGFSVLVGTTALVSFGLQRGADGFIPSAGNLNPSLCTRMC